MSENYILSCESTVDLPYSYVAGRNIPVLFYTYTVDGKEYEDHMVRTKEAYDRFYKFLDDGFLPRTSQINEFKYTEYLENLLQKGDVLHIVFGTGMTTSYLGAISAAEALREKYPERKLIVIDSTCSCTGYGLLVDIAADLRDEGKSIEEVAAWVENHKHKIGHQFFSTDMKFFRRSGRVSGVAATVASVLGICPLMCLNYDGKIVAYEKVRGVKKTIIKTVDEVVAHIEKEPKHKIYISNSNCRELASEVKALIEKRLPQYKNNIHECQIGSIITAHCGPGTVAVFFVGDDRPKIS